VLAVAAAPDGSSAWAVGGYAGTPTAAGIGSGAILPARPAGWRTASIWRYDVGGPVPAPSLTQATVSIPAQPGTVSFAFFSSPMCNSQCAAVQDAQPDVNLRAAAAQIADFAAQPGGPSFAILGGNARGPIDLDSYLRGLGAIDLARLPRLLSPLGSVPLFAAYGPLDGVPTSSDPAQPWAEAFKQSPGPFGQGPLPAGITAVGSGALTAGVVHRYYAFDVTQNGGTLRVIVLDNSAGTLESSSAGQLAWLDAQLAAAQGVGLPIVVIVARPLNRLALGAASDGAAVASRLAAAGVLAVFTTSGGLAGAWATQTDQVTMVPYSTDPNAIQLPEYEGATLTYQQPQNNGVLWYFASVDTVARKLKVNAIPVVDTLALKPLEGLNVARSSTLYFTAVGRRPTATVATAPTNDSFPGYDNYVEIPASNCAGCIGPSYVFASSDPTIGDFVLPSSPGSLFPLLDASGKPTRSNTSGLFCAFNAGTVTVSVTSGRLTASLPVTVRDGDFGRPCGTVPPSVNTHVTQVNTSRVIKQPVDVVQPTVALNQPVVVQTTQPAVPVIPLPAAPAIPAPPVPAPPPAPAPTPTPAPAPAPLPAPPAAVASSPPAPPAVVAPAPVAVPPIPPAVTPVPPGGATAQAPSAARRQEKARRHASQSAYVIRPAGVPGTSWFYPALGVLGILAVLLAAEGLSGPRPRRELVELWEPGAGRPRRGRWR
jgi:hypothetical protein